MSVQYGDIFGSFSKLAFEALKARRICSGNLGSMIRKLD